MKLNDVVITGMGAVTPLGNDVKTFWKNLLAGTSGANPITHFDSTEFKTKFACELKGFNPEDYMDRKDARKMDKYSQYAMVAAAEAVADSQIDGDVADLTRCGVIWASGIGGIETFEEQLENFFKKGEVPRFNPFFIPKLLADSAAGLISIKYGFQGVNYCPVAACASSTNALIEGFNYVRWGKADVVVAGGSEAPITRASLGGFNALRALSTNNENYQSASKPFDVNRDGFVAGEGAGAIILENKEHALKRGAKIYVEVVGGGVSADAYHVTSTHPEGAGAVLSMGHAIREAGISPGEIDYINTHATSTPAGDVSEILGIAKLFAGHLDKLNISATKSMTGHLLGAAGAIESIALAMSVHDDAIPPTINTTDPDPEIPKEMNLTLGKSQKKQVNYALSNTFGFGGHNASVVMKKYSG